MDADGFVRIADFGLCKEGKYIFILFYFFVEKSNCVVFVSSVQKVKALDFVFCQISELYSVCVKGYECTWIVCN